MCAFLHKAMFIFLKSTKIYEFFYIIFPSKKFHSLLMGFFDFLESKNAFALGITQNIKNRQKLTSLTVQSSVCIVVFLYSRLSVQSSVCTVVCLYSRVSQIV